MSEEVTTPSTPTEAEEPETVYAEEEIPETVYVEEEISETVEPRLSDGSGSIKATGNTITSGTCGANLTWVLTSDGTLTISGSGDMYDYDGFFDGRTGPLPPWYDYNNLISSVVIEDGVTNIGNYAFGDCDMSSIEIPGSVTALGELAFCYCLNLTEITIPEGVVSIGNDAFNSCEYLEAVSLPNSLISIGEYAFCDCTSLASIDIPEGVTTIGACAFAYSGLASIVIPDSVEKIGVGAFTCCYSLEHQTA